MARKRCKKGYHKSKSGTRCVKVQPKRKTRSGATKKCPTMKTLSRQWKNMSPAAKKRFKKRGKKTNWNIFVANKSFLGISPKI